MWQAIFGGILVFAGFYLIIKCFVSRRKGVHLDSTLVGFKQEKGTLYPVFKFTYKGEELTLPGGVPAEPQKFKFEEGENVRIIFTPNNKEFVDIEGSKTEYLYGIASIVLGAIFIYFYLRKIGVI